MTPGSGGRHLVVHRFGQLGARPKVYLQAALHANELPGAMALHHLMPMLAKADAAGRVRGEVVVVPTVNPIGLSQLVGNRHLGRYEQLGRDNFNRNWLDLAPAVAERVGERLGADAGRPLDDTLGGDRHREAFAEADDRDDDRLRVGAAAHRGDEAAVDLDPVERQGAQLRERRIAAAEVVKADRHALVLEAGYQRVDPAGVLV